MSMMTKELSFSAMADAIDAVLRAGVLNHLRKAGIRDSEISFLIDGLQKASATLRFLAQMQSELRRWIMQRGVI